MVEGIVKHLKKGDVALKTLCANALFKVGVEIIFLTYFTNIILTCLRKLTESICTPEF